MKRRSDRKRAVDYADKWFSLYIRDRDKKCAVCGSSGSLQCGHIFSRIAYSTRWDERNAFALCSSDNMAAEYDPWPMLEAARKKGIKLDVLHLDYVRPRKFSTEEIRSIGDFFKEKVNEQGGGDGKG